VRWLLAQWPPGKPEPTKYWLASLPEAAPLVELVRLARLRWRVEQDYRELKGALGLDHFEGRGFLGWHHHVTLVSVAHGFLTLERLRSPNLVASARACGSCWVSCRACWPVGPAPVRCASIPHHGGSVDQDDHQPQPDRGRRDDHPLDRAACSNGLAGRMLAGPGLDAGARPPRGRPGAGRDSGGLPAAAAGTGDRRCLG
jgi:Transposase DDE domain